MHPEQLEQTRAQVLHTLRFRWKDVLNILREKPVTHISIGVECLEGASARHEKDCQPGQHGHQSENAQLPVANDCDAIYCTAPQRRRHERGNTLENEHQPHGRKKMTRQSRYGYLPPLPGVLKYLKKSELGSMTRTSLLLLKPALYASRLR